MKKSGSRKTLKKDKIKFYDVFRIGLELEGEFINEPNEEGYQEFFRVASDGSLDHQGYEERGHLMELEGSIIEEETQQKRFINFFKKLEVPVGEDGRYKQFALNNNTAGTHLHFSFKRGYIEKILNGVDTQEKFGVSSMTMYKYYHLIFDGVDFERYFFRRYFNCFKLSKFWDRLGNNYCKPFSDRETNRKADIRDFNLYNIERKKGGRRDKYQWLNTLSLANGEGVEIRIFPYLVTAGGIEDVIEFSKDVLKGFLVQKATKRKIRLIERFFEIKKNYKFNENFLRKYDRALLTSFTANSGVDFNRPSITKLSIDLIEFYCYLFDNNKKAFEPRNPEQEIDENAHEDSEREASEDRATPAFSAEYLSND